LGIEASSPASATRSNKWVSLSTLSSEIKVLTKLEAKRDRLCAAATRRGAGETGYGPHDYKHGFEIMHSSRG
jgi:hypothetical protein